MKNILFCTLGGSWAVIPEVYAFLAPDQLALYQHHPKRDELEALRTEYELQPPDEIWICTTQGVQTQNSLTSLKKWFSLLSAKIFNPPLIRIWQAADTNQLATQQECAIMRELILRACLKAQEQLHGGQLTLSLAGGRKTMSADVQWAGSLFGCQALIHVVGTEPLPPLLRSAEPALFTQALDAELCNAIFPLVTGQATRSEYLDISIDGREAISSKDFFLPLPTSITEIVWTSPIAMADRLEIELKNREKAGSQLLGNYLFDIDKREQHENWRSLYRLPLRMIEQLRKTTLSPKHRHLLQKIPKADLHCHVGGCLDISAQRIVGLAIWQSLNETEQEQALQLVKPLLDNSYWDWSWTALLRQKGNRTHNVAALLVKASDEQLQINLFTVTEPRVALKTRHKYSFAAYERPGELTGSALLNHPAAIAPYAQLIVKQAVADGVAYLELRGSPQKYGDGLTFLRQFHAALQKEVSTLHCGIQPEFRFIVIADRRNTKALADTIAVAIAAKHEMPDFIVGLDVAGDERVSSPKEIAAYFLPAFEQCLPVTIHAGEGEAADLIWQAAYHLHADRIGHGLSVSDYSKLAARFRDRDICLELCPTSNREVVGYQDSEIPESVDCLKYPLQKLWQLGLPLTLCTDNPGISRTTLTDEYLVAARMMGNKLTWWDALAMIKQAFIHAFLPSHEKEKLVKQADKEIYNLIMQLSEADF